MPIPGQDPAFDKTNFYLTKLQTISPEAGKVKHLLNASAGKEDILAYWKSVKESINNAQVKKVLYVLVIKPIQRALGKISPVPTDQDSKERTEAIGFVMSLSSGKEPGVKSMRDSLPKGVNPTNFTLNSPRICTALDKIIKKLAALQQPLGIRPDYDSGQGTTGDMSERLKKIKESLSENDAAMLKMIPPMQDPKEKPQPCSPETPAMADYDEGPQPEAEGPKIIVIENYDEEPDTSCCPGCGQALPIHTAREADALDHKFRAIRDTLRKSDLKESQLKIIHGNLDAIYNKYRALEKKEGED